MHAIVLTFDRQIEFAKLVIESYMKLWPNCPFVFRIPYNDKFPDSLAHKSNVELIHTTKDIRPTMCSLLADINDDEFVFWAIDDRYPVEIKNPSVLEQILAFISDPHVNVDGIKLTNHGQKICSDKVQEVIGGTKFRLQIESPALGFYMHHFVKAKVLRKYFLGFDLPRNYTIRQFHHVLLKERMDERILMPEKSLIYFGEACIQGKMTRNCLYDLRRYSLNVPDIECIDRIIVYGARGEKMSKLRYKLRLIRTALGRK